MDLSQRTIEDLFFRQVKRLTQKSTQPVQGHHLFDLQFSDQWVSP